MRDLRTLDKTLLQSEFELTRVLYESLRNQGYAPLKAAAMIYRHGYLDGKDTQKDRVAEAYKKLYSVKNAQNAEKTSAEPDEANTEGSEQHVDG